MDRARTNWAHTSSDATTTHPFVGPIEGDSIALF